MAAAGFSKPSEARTESSLMLAKPQMKSAMPSMASATSALAALTTTGKASLGLRR